MGNRVNEKRIVRLTGNDGGSRVTTRLPPGTRIEKQIRLELFRFGRVSCFGRWLYFVECQNFFVEKTEIQLIPHRAVAGGNRVKAQRTIYPRAWYN